jgi:hypothetical protein
MPTRPRWHHPAWRPRGVHGRGRSAPCSVMICATDSKCSALLRRLMISSCNEIVSHHAVTIVLAVNVSGLHNRSAGGLALGRGTGFGRLCQEPAAVTSRSTRSPFSSQWHWTTRTRLQVLSVHDMVRAIAERASRGNGFVITSSASGHISSWSCQADDGSPSGRRRIRQAGLWIPPQPIPGYRDGDIRRPPSISGMITRRGAATSISRKR